jgi:predicted nucleotidyltransferase
MHELVQPILDEAERDDNVVGVLIKGSQAMGVADEESDWDVVVVLLQGEPSQKKDVGSN